ncbi:MAG: hypothetical protein LJE70_05415 [Chromatiaceae bacterium]|nr:hypothetical protein [Chromatiaceae bacterium]
MGANSWISAHGVSRRLERKALVRRYLQATATPTLLGYLYLDPDALHKGSHVGDYANLASQTVEGIQTGDSQVPQVLVGMRDQHVQGQSLGEVAELAPVR